MDGQKPKRKHRSWFEQLPYDSRYLVFSAIRGPDHGIRRTDDEIWRPQIPFICVLKEVVTQRMRSIVFPQKLTTLIPGDISHRPITERHIAHLKDAVENIISNDKSRYDAAHFASHLVRALEVTATHPIWGSKKNAFDIKKLLNQLVR